MKNQKTIKHMAEVDENIERQFKELAEHDSNSTEFDDVLGNINKLCGVKDQLEAAQPNIFKHVDFNTIVSAGVTLVSILLILNYEKSDIITTKSMSLISKWLGK